MLLAIDTATRTLSLALHDGQTVLAESSWQTRAGHTVELPPSAAIMLARVGVTPAQLRGLAVAIGPGSYTGLRIGLGFAKGLCLALKGGPALLGIPTLDILASAQPPRAEPMRAVLSLGRSRLAVGSYVYEGQEWVAQGPPQVMDWPALVESLDGPAWVCGEIDAQGQVMLRKARGRAIVAPPAGSLRRAGVLAELGWQRLRQGQKDDVATLAPVYLGQGEPAAS